MTSDDVKRHLGVHPRPGSSAWQFKRQPPDDLAHLYPSGWARRCSLKTADLREANRRAALLWAETDAEFAAHRRRLNPETVTLTQALAETLGAAWRHEMLRDDEGARLAPQGIGSDHARTAATFTTAPALVTSGGTRVAMLSADLIPDEPADPFAGYNEAQAQAIASQYREALEGWREDAARGRLDVAKRALDTQARKAGLILDWSAPDARAILAGFQRLMVETAESLVARTEGRMVPTPEAPQVAKAPAAPSASTEAPRIADALDAWKRKGRRLDKTAMVFTAHAAVFARLMDDPPLRSIDRQAAIRFRDRLQQEAITEKKTATTANNILTSVKTLANVARDEGWIEGEPFGRLIVKEGGADTEDREPWTAAELAQLFATPLFAAYDIPRSPAKAGLDAAYWLPLIAACTGARPSEIAQLWTDDVAELPGGLVVEFRANAERGQRLKNKASWRAVPIHSALIRLGFADYWRTVAEDGPRPLFPALPVKSVNGAAAQFGTWFGDYKRARGFDSTTKTLHSFRHSVETELAHAGVPTQLVDAITGHAGQGTGRKVYAATIRRDAERLRPWVERLAYRLPDGTDALALPRVFTAPVWSPSTTTPRKTRAAR